MSYDLMVFDSAVAPKERKDFMAWFTEQAEWAEDHTYEDHAVSTERLQAWFMEMIINYPAMNGPLASDDDIDNSKVTDYCIGKNVIYSAFAWSVADEALPHVRNLAIKHGVGFFDVSTDGGEILFPDSLSVIKTKKPWWKFL